MQPHTFCRYFDDDVRKTSELYEDLWEVPADDVGCVGLLAVEPQVLTSSVPHVPTGEGLVMADQDSVLFVSVHGNGVVVGIGKPCACSRPRDMTSPQ
jgi:hypothetical protein